MATQVFSFPQTSIPTGTFPVSKSSLPASITSLTLSLARCTTNTPTIWPNATTTVTGDLQVSLDGGVTFQDLGGFSSPGGIFTQKDGTQLTNTVCTWTLPPNATHLQGTLVVANGPCVTSGSVTVS